MVPRPHIWLAACAVLLWGGAMARDRLDAWVDTTVLPPVLAETGVEMRDRNGKLLRVYQVGNGIWRLDPGPVDPGFVAMLVRYEDKRFYSHSGVDPLAMLRAAGQALRHGKTVSGGSTLTMQVARLIEDGPTGRWAGKLRQIRVALTLERRLPKERILSLYLRHAPYGGNIEGVRAASLAWFGKEPRRLTAAQSAVLVALPQAPEARRPDRNMDASKSARDRVLHRLAEQGTLSTADVRAALSEPLPTALHGFPQLAPHLADRMRAEDPTARQFDTTLDADIQRKMEALVAEAARKAGGRVSAALVAADHQTGEILASVGSAAYEPARQGFVDMTRALRSPGSTLKPFVYGLAFDQGLAHPESLIQDSPVMFGRYAPRNFDGQFRGEVRVREALQLSLNIPVVRLTEALGPVRLMAALTRGGASAQLPSGSPGLAVALGGVGISLNDLVQLYAGLAQGGRGPLLWYDRTQPRTTSGRIMSDVAAWQVGNILAGLTPPPGARKGILAYKTGTSYGHRDTWAIGYDGNHVIGVWLGRPDGTPVPGAFGGDVAAPVLFEAFGRLKPDFSPLPPPPHATLLLGSAELPQPLQRFRPRNAAFDEIPNAPQLLFPPDGAALYAEDGEITLKLRGGSAPFSVLVNGEPVVTKSPLREIAMPITGRGFTTLLVLDAKGQADRATITLR
ncbi:penicillin-binding protein 1C [Ruegeria sp. PrR005]|uniref:peptidoglycan glycosyltransferase n=2 Tax=Ruegeria sp. PrR005 TaxID=2706882 RepID=A0A6B2NPD7_9RHOB|nr:penicillin-binding protein 1C [Ruegeria sp. PrR005]